MAENEGVADFGSKLVEDSGQELGADLKTARSLDLQVEQRLLDAQSERTGYGCDLAPSALSAAWGGNLRVDVTENVVGIEFAAVDAMAEGN